MPRANRYFLFSQVSVVTANATNEISSSSAEMVRISVQYRTWWTTGAKLFQGRLVWS